MEIPGAYTLLGKPKYCKQNPPWGKEASMCGWCFSWKRAVVDLIQKELDFSESNVVEARFVII